MTEHGEPETVEDSPRPGTQGPAARRAHRPARTVPAVLLMIVAVVLAPLSVAAVWAADFVGDTGRYVATVGPLASNPDVQAAVTNRVTNVVIDQLDVPAKVQTLVSALEARGLGGGAASVLNGLSGPLEQGVDRFVRGTVAGVVAGPEFASLWTNLNARAHSAVVTALTGQGGGVVQVAGNDVNVDLAPIIEQVKAQLVASGLGLAANIPTVHTTFTVYSSDTVPAVKTGFRLLQIAGDWLPVCTVLIGAAGVLLAVHRRTALIGVALGVALSMTAFGAALSVGRTITLQQLPADVSVPAVSAVFDAVLHFLRETIRMLGVLACAVALGAFLSGPHRFAVALRGYCVAGIGTVRGAFDRGAAGPGRVARINHRVRGWLTGAVLAAASLVFVLWDHPTPAVIAWTGVLVLVALAILEFLDPSTPAET